jgi:FkbM family methyltransferase
MVRTQPAQRLRNVVRRLLGGGRADLVTDEAGQPLWRVSVGDVTFTVADVGTSSAVAIIAAELGRGVYAFDDIDFAPGDVVLDVGAHVGCVSIYLAKRYPNVRVIAFEPTPPTFATLVENIRRNHVTNIEAVNKAVSGDGRDLDMVVHLGSNSGGATSSMSNLDRPEHLRFTVPSTTLDDVFRERGIAHCRLLKVDTEGSEHEVLLNSSALGRITDLRGEFHENAYLRSKGYSIDRLIEHCAERMGRRHVRVTRCQMAEG